MGVPHVFKWRDVDPNTDFKWGAVKSGASHDGFSVPLTVRNNDTGTYHEFVHLGPEIPQMAIPFGLKAKESKFGTRYSADMTFPGVCRNEEGELVGDKELVDYCNWLQSIEDLNKKMAHEQCKQWFGKELKPEIIDEFYFKSLSESSKPESYSPTLTTRLEHSGGAFKTKFFNQDGKEIKFEDITAGSRVIPLIKTLGLWFAGKSFGMSYKIVQMMVFEREQFDACVITNPYQPVVEETPDAISPAFNLPEKDLAEPGAKRQKVEA